MHEMVRKLELLIERVPRNSRRSFGNLQTLYCIHIKAALTLERAGKLNVITQRRVQRVLLQAGGTAGEVAAEQLREPLPLHVCRRDYQQH